MCSKRQIDQSEIEMTDGWITDDGNDSEEDKKMKNQKKATTAAANSVNNSLECD